MDGHTFTIRLYIYAIHQLILFIGLYNISRKSFVEYVSHHSHVVPFLQH